MIVLSRRWVLGGLASLIVASIICYPPYQVGGVLIWPGVSKSMVSPLMGPSQSMKGYYDFWDNGLFAVMVEYGDGRVTKREIHLLPWAHQPPSLTPVLDRTIVGLFSPIVWGLLLCVCYVFSGWLSQTSSDQKDQTNTSASAGTVPKSSRRLSYGKLLCMAVLVCYVLTWLIGVGAFAWDRFLTENEPRYSRETFERVREGMTREGVMATVGGRPGGVQKGIRGSRIVLDYTDRNRGPIVYEEWICEEARMLVQFGDDGRAMKVLVFLFSSENPKR
jgi:hypothetical protein